MRVVVLVVVLVVVVLVTGVKQSQLIGLRLSLEFDNNTTLTIRCAALRKKGYYFLLAIPSVRK